jgi:hypothetical protein
VSGVSAACSAGGCCWGCSETPGCVAAGAAVFVFAAAFGSSAGGFGAKKYDHPKRTIIESTAAIKNLDWPCLSCCSTISYFGF